MHNDFRMSSRTRTVAVAVKAINGMSNFKNFKLSLPKFSLKTHSRLKWRRSYWWEKMVSDWFKYKIIFFFFFGSWKQLQYELYHVSTCSMRFSLWNHLLSLTFLSFKFKNWILTHYVEICFNHWTRKLGSFISTISDFSWILVAL